MQHYQVNSISAKQFTISNKWFVSEASTLQDYALQQLLNSSGQRGFAVFNPKTMGMTRWALQSTPRDGDGDVIAWIYVPTADTLQKHPQMQGWEVHVLND